MAGKKDIVEQALRLIIGTGEEAASKAKLPMDLDNRMYRASEMGFDPTRRYYHLTRKDFDAFKLGADPSSHTGGGAIWLREDPRYNISAHQVPSFEAEGARDIPLFIRPTKELPTMEWSLLRQQGKLNDQFPLVVTPEENKMLRDMGYSHASLGGETVVFDPKDLRSPHAVFDPDEAESADYMKSSGGSIREGYGPGGWVDDVVKMAGKVISGEGEDAAKAGIRAYHGSPHDFDKFSLDKIGTGEGAQAYGHGLYFAGNEDIARHYRQALSGAPTVQYKGDDYALPAALSELKEWRTANPEGSAYLEGLRKKTMEDAAKILLENVGGGSDAPGVLRNLVNSFPSAAQDTAKGWVEQAEKLIKPHLTVNEPGHMYEVNIAANPEQFLDWDKPLSEQPQNVLDVARPFFSEGLPERKQYGEIVKGGDLYDMLVQRSGGVMHGPKLDAAGIPSRLPGGTKERLGMYLSFQGIPGIKYLDAGSRGKGVAQVQVMYKGKPHGDPIPVQAWNQVDQLTNDYKAKGYDVEVQDLGTRNYVVFDDKLISIIRKYGIAGASAMLGYNLMEQLDPKQALAASMADQDYQSSRPQRSMGGNNSISSALNVARGLNGGK